jgi:hypothetical protein
MRFPRPGFMIIAFALALLRNAPCAAGDGMETMDAKGRWPSDIVRESRAEKLAAKERLDGKAAEKAEFESRISLPIPDGACLARHRSQGACLLTAGEFNAHVQVFNQGLRDSSAGKADLAASRQMILNGMKDKMFLDGRLMENREPSLRQNLRKAEADRARDLEKGIGADGLKAIYRKYQDGLFARKRKVTVAFLAASDSAFLDSLRGDYLEHGGSSTGNVSDAGDAPNRKTFLWQTAELRDLPKEAETPVSGLKPGEVSLPIPCPFGWMIASPVEIRDLPAMSYEAAMPQLLALSAFPEPRAAVPAPGAAMGKDTVEPELRMWLMPYARTRARAFTPASWKDTAGIRPMILRVSRLPPVLFREAAKALPWRKSILVKDKLGVFYLQAPTRISAAAFSPWKPADGNVRDAESVLREMQDVSEAKSRDFRLAFVRSHMERSSSGEDYARFRQKWIAENVALDTALLNP